jgi:hypothetical protein
MKHSERKQLKEKECTQCTNVKPRDCFRLTSKGYLISMCKDCEKVNLNKWRRDHKKMVKQQARRKYINTPRKLIWARGTISNHKKDGIEFKFTPKQLETFVSNINECFFCGKELCWDNNASRDNSPSLENLHTKTMLTLSDIVIVCFLCNTTKGKRTFIEFLNYCKDITEKFNTVGNI